MRVHELAKQLGLANKELLGRLEALGFEGKTHSSSLTPQEIAAVEKRVKGATQEKKQEKEPVKKAAAATAPSKTEKPQEAPRSAAAPKRPGSGRPSSTPKPPPRRPRVAGRTSPAGAAGSSAGPTRAGQSLPGADRRSRVQQMFIKRKLARRQKATQQQVEAPPPEPEITIQIIEEEEKPRRKATTPAPARIVKEEPTQAPQAAEGRKGEAKPEKPKMEAGIVAPGPDKADAGPKRKGRKRGVDDKKEAARKRAAREKGRVKDHTREVITNGIEVLKEVTVAAPVLKAPTPLASAPAPWAGKRRRRMGGGRTGRSRKAIRRERKVRMEQQLLEEQRLQEEQRTIVNVNEATTVADLAESMRIPTGELIGKLMSLGVFAAKNQRLERETIDIICEEFGFEVRETSLLEDEGILGQEEPDLAEDLAPRPPVVTIMGHVDHGKTKLLDAVRKSNVVDSEAGGITQHIGAYDVTLKGGRVIFLDTPGHEAFTAMRARGAMVTDIVVLVVAADDGIMPQTIEAIHHAKAASVPIVVAINKIDKAGADSDRVRTELGRHDLLPEQWGGKTPTLEISALKNLGIQELLEHLLLESEVLELKANPNRRARGTIIEAKMDPGRGPVATVLVQSGTLKIGDNFVTGVFSGKVRALVNDMGEYIEEAGPSTPIEVLGLEGVPVSGDPFMVVADERAARHLSLKLQQIQRTRELRKIKHVSLEDLHAQITEGAIKELDLVVKADVQGSVGALCDALERLPSDKVKTNVIHSGVGAVSESDVMLASASNALILAFNLRPNPTVEELAEREHVDIRTYRVIYDAIADIRAALEGMLESKFKEKSLGRCDVREVFRADRQLVIAGGYVTSGKLMRNAQMRVLRDDVVIFEGKLDSLRRFKEDVKEVASGFECGVGISQFGDIKLGDVIECYELEEVKQTLDS